MIRKILSLFKKQDKSGETTTRRHDDTTRQHDGATPRRRDDGHRTPPKSHDGHRARRGAPTDAPGRTHRSAPTDAGERNRRGAPACAPSSATADAHGRTRRSAPTNSPSHTPWDPASFTVPEAEGKKRFHDFDLPAEIMHAIFDLGFQYCTPIQAETLGLTMEGRNVAGRAQTGTGKTAAFLIAILKRMKTVPSTRAEAPGNPAALVIAPTRELVIQIAKDARELAIHCGIRCVAVYGGMDHEKQQRELSEAPVDILVATPGRLLDFCGSKAVSLKAVHTLVIDEADRMLDMGFIPDVRRIIRQIPVTRQTLLFSATLDDSIMRLAAQWMPDPVKIEVDTEKKTVDTITQVVYPIAAKEKFTILYNFLKKENAERVLIFCNRKTTCDHLHDNLTRFGITAEVLSGDVDQKKRFKTLEAFRAGTLKVVVATDVAGRGLHIEDVNYVVNFDFPYQADDYVHRIGRTGRAGCLGTAISFACEDESFIIPDIEKLLEMPLPCHAPPDEFFAPLPEPIRSVRSTRHASR
ncbi:MAG: DEAD/DEAH box helicase, partial [Kiritimatiellaeota bacterium]|nr:DEAD/DEAH box helicase [Kiritimatiellota bacterium]